MWLYFTSVGLQIVKYPKDKRRSFWCHWPLCSAAAVASDLIAAPTNTPCCQLKASYTRGTPEENQSYICIFANLLLLCAPNLHLYSSRFNICSPSGLLPPKMMASMGTPSGDSHCGSIIGHWLAGVQKRELGWAQGSPIERKTRQLFYFLSSPRIHSLYFYWTSRLFMKSVLILF